MSPRFWLALPLFAILVGACGGDSADSDDESTDENTEVIAEDMGGAAEESAAGATADSIPMEITVTTTGGQNNNNGTFRARGMGERCTFDPNAQPGVTSAAWNIAFATEDTTGVQLLNLEVGAPTSGTTTPFALTLVAGTSTAAGMTMPMRYMVATWPGGAQLGSGTASVRREGDGAHFEVEAVDGASKTQISLRVTCTRLGAVN